MLLYKILIIVIILNSVLQLPMKVETIFVMPWHNRSNHKSLGLFKVEEFAEAFQLWLSLRRSLIATPTYTRLLFNHQQIGT